MPYSGFLPRITFRRLIFGILILIVLVRYVLSWITRPRSSASSLPPKDGCEHVLGRELVVDDHARVCLWDSPNWNRKSGCCLTDLVDECASCSGSPFLCCERYESCVACCQQRGTAFKFCLQNCRFSSKNVEGIRFKGPKRYCTRG